MATMSAVAVVGLTGGICSGKSSVSRALREQASAHTAALIIIDADVVGHSVYADPESDCYKALVEHFGNGIVNSENRSIDRKALGSIVFSDKSQMKALQNIVWPAISLQLQQKVAEIKAELTTDRRRTVVLIEAAIMLEAGWEKDIQFDLLMATQVESDVARERLMARNGLSAEDADKRLASQLSNDERAGRVNVVIDNNASEEALRERLQEVWRDNIEPTLELQK